MTLPDFLGLGAQRAGTTWLDRLLRLHPDVYLPERRKEVHFFDQAFDRGTEWYERFFPPAGEASRYRRIGEITPRYLYEPAAPGRIASLLPEVRMIVLLRDPVTRLYSQYGLHVRDLGERRDFPTYVREHREAFERGLYSHQLARYFERFDRERFLILIYEEAVAEPEAAIEAIARFLEIDPEPLRRGLGRGAVNASYAPRWPRLRAFARGIGSALRARGADRVVNVAKRLGVPRLFGRRPMPPMGRDPERELVRRYRDEVASLEELLGRPLPAWRGRPAGSGAADAPE